VKLTGYIFTIASASPAEAYTIDARPKTARVRAAAGFFYSDQNMIVRQSDKERTSRPRPIVLSEVEKPYKMQPASGTCIAAYYYSSSARGAPPEL